MLWGFANTGKGFVIMTNSDNGSAVTWEIIRSISEVYGWDIFKPIVRKVISTNQDSLRRFEGTYQMNPEYIVQITAETNKLHVKQNWDQNEYWLYPGSELVFFSLEDNTELVFEEDAKGKIVKFTVAGTFVFEKT
jgi:hypothetical protein